jgi:hypothetical protein
VLNSEHIMILMRYVNTGSTLPTTTEAFKTRLGIDQLQSSITTQVNNVLQTYGQVRVLSLSVLRTCLGQSLMDPVDQSPLLLFSRSYL